MTEKSIKAPHFFLKGIAIACLFHVALFSGIKIVMPVKQQPNQPQLQFLGSFLSDFNFNPNAGSIKPQLTFSKEESREILRNETPLFHERVNKPDYVMSEITQKPLSEKITPKLLFPVLLEKEEKEINQDLNRLGISVDSTPYKSIRHHLP